MTLDTTTTVREWAVDMPGATRIFEKFKIDYCCGGSTPLAVACEKAGVEIDEVVRLLGAGRNSESEGNVLTNFQALSLTELTAYIVNKHHLLTREEIERLQSLFAKVCSVHGENHTELFRLNAVFDKLRAELEPH